MAKILSFAVCTLLIPTVFMILAYGNGHSLIYGLNNFFIDVNLGRWLFYGTGGGFIYVVIGDFFTELFNSFFSSRSIARHEKKQELQRIKEHNIEIEKKRRELELEFEHLQRIMLLQANIDQGKLVTLQDMQNTLKSQKMSDLDLLRKQIEMMKRG